MKSKLFVFLFFSLAALVSQACTSKVKQNDTAKSIQQYDEDKKINIKLENGKAEVTFLKQHLNTVSLVFYTEGYNHIKASILSDGNVRFNTVGFDNEEDGPYGKDLDLPLNKSGMYNLNLGPSLMAENYAKDVFEVTVQIDLSNE